MFARRFLLKTSGYLIFSNFSFNLWRFYLKLEPRMASGGNRFYGLAPNSSSSTRKWRIVELQPNMQQTVLIGLVIVKNSPRFVANRQGVDRYVMNLTLRDSRRDTINATCWGGEEFIKGLCVSFAIGDVVEIQNAEIRLLSVSNENSQFKPNATSPYSLTINECVSRLSLSSESAVVDLEALIHVPMSPSCELTSLAQVQENGEASRGVHVNILVSVRKVGIPRELVSSKTGQPFLKCDVTVFDQTLNSFFIQIWDAEWIHYARTWTPKDCVILAQDVKLNYDNYRKTMVATSDGRTVFTVNPDMREALMLYTFTQSVVLSEDNLDDNFDLDSIQDIYNAESIREKLDSKSGPFRGILYAQLTYLDLDGDSFLTATRCSKCKRVVNAVSCLCVNLDCPAGAGLEVTQSSEQLDLQIWLSDHTATIEKARLRGQVAESFLGCTVQEFLKLNPMQKTMLKWQFLLERVKCYFQASVYTNGNGMNFQPLAISRVDVSEYCAKVTISKA